MHPPSERLLDNAHFNKKISKYLPDDELDKFYEYDELYLRSCIFRLAAQDGCDLAATNIQHAVKQADQLDAQRKKRPFVLRGALKAQTLAASMIDFLDSFSPIGDIMKGIDPRAGGIAYGTLYILLKVGHNKQRHEDLVTRGLKDFSIMLNQIHVYHVAHLTEERMLGYIGEAYNGIIEFARKASMYYVQSGVRRLWKTVIAKSDKDGLERQSERVRSEIENIVKEAAAIMSRRVGIVAKNQTYEHNDSLAAVRKLLQLPRVTTSCANTMDACSTIYTPELFARVSRRGRTILLQEADTAFLSTAGLLDQFQCPTQPSLLLVSGTNHHSLPNTNGLCWLSPVTLEIGRQATGPLAFCSTHYAGHVDSVRQRDTLTNLVDAILYQLLIWDDDVARKCCGTVKRAACAETWQTEPMKARRGLLLELLNALAEVPSARSHNNNRVHTKPTTIVIDRLDAVSIEPEGGGKRERPSGDELLDFVEMLLEVLAEAKGTVKVVVTMHAAFTEESRPEMRYRWEVLEKDWEKKREKNRESPKLVCRREWEQGTREAEGQESEN